MTDCAMDPQPGIIDLLIDGEMKAWVSFRDLEMKWHAMQVRAVHKRYLNHLRKDDGDVPVVVWCRLCRFDAWAPVGYWLMRPRRSKAHDFGDVRMAIFDNASWDCVYIYPRDVFKARVLRWRKACESCVKDPHSDVHKRRRLTTKELMSSGGMPFA
jgi:hypothetical protein